MGSEIMRTIITSLVVVSLFAINACGTSSTPSQVMGDEDAGQSSEKQIWPADLVLEDVISSRANEAALDREFLSRHHATVVTVVPARDRTEQELKETADMYAFSRKFYAGVAMDKRPGGASVVNMMGLKPIVRRLATNKVASSLKAVAGELVDLHHVYETQDDMLAANRFARESTGKLIETFGIDRAEDRTIVLCLDRNGELVGRLVMPASDEAKAKFLSLTVEK
jgi:hypothetical protein